MTDKSAAAAREFAEKWGIRQNDEPTIDPHTESPYYGYSRRTKQCLSDLTALISEHYVSKEDVNQEVEKRIAERMPSEEEIDDKSIKMFDSAAFRAGIKWLRSRLTKTHGTIIKCTNLKKEK